MQSEPDSGPILRRRNRNPAVMAMVGMITVMSVGCGGGSGGTATASKPRKTVTTAPRKNAEVRACEAKLASITDGLVNGGSTGDVLFEYGQQDEEAMFAIGLAGEVRSRAYQVGREGATDYAVQKISTECWQRYG